MVDGVFARWCAIHAVMRWRSSKVSGARMSDFPLRDAGPEWIEVGVLDDMTDNRLAVEFDGLSVLVLRNGESLIAFENSCPHLCRPLSDGHITGTVIRCPGHGYRWNVISGRRAGRSSAGARRGVLRHVPVMAAGDRVFLRRPGDSQQG
jgi:3-phenylpropionate/trans-cinnamate dioxygenase ferredoxin component